MVQGHDGVAGGLGDSVLREWRSAREDVELDLGCGRPLHSGRNGRHAHVPGAAEDAAVPTGLYGIRGMRWMQAAARGAAVIPSRRRCLITQSVVQ